MLDPLGLDPPVGLLGWGVGVVLKPVGSSVLLPLPLVVTLSGGVLVCEEEEEGVVEGDRVLDPVAHGLAVGEGRRVGVSAPVPDPVGSAGEGEVEGEGVCPNPPPSEGVVLPLLVCSLVRDPDPVARGVGVAANDPLPLALPHPAPAAALGVFASSGVGVGGFVRVPLGLTDPLCVPPLSSSPLEVVEGVLVGSVETLGVFKEVGVEDPEMDTVEVTEGELVTRPL